MKRSSILPTVQRVTAPEGTVVEVTAQRVQTRSIPQWLWTVLLMTVLFSVHCGGEEVCPSGTSGEPCKPTTDLGPQPEVPAKPDIHIADTAIGESDTAMDTHTKDIEHNDLQVGDGTDIHPTRTLDANEDGDGLSTPTDDTEQADATRESASYFEHLDSIADKLSDVPKQLS